MGASVSFDDTPRVLRPRLLQEELAASIDEQAHRTLFVLTVVTVLALPINMIAGVFGMNVGGIPLANHEHGFSVVALTLIVITATLAVVTARKTSG